MKTRSCGTCTACCTSLAVKELDKPQGVVCNHLSRTSKGCDRYDTRPQSCRNFECLWLRDHKGSLIDGEFRPDRCGLVLDVTTPHSELPQAIVVHEVWPGASQQVDGQRLLARLSSRAVVIVVSGGNRILRGPHTLVAAYQAKMLHRS